MKSALNLKKAAVSAPSPTRYLRVGDGLGVSYGTVEFLFVPMPAPNGKDTLEVGFEFADFFFARAVPPSGSENLVMGYEFTDFLFKSNIQKTVNESAVCGFDFNDFFYKTHPSAPTSETVSLGFEFHDFEYTGEAAGMMTTPIYLSSMMRQPMVAWSLDRISDNATRSVRVRRSSDDTEADIGFIGGYLDVYSLLGFVGSGSGYVRTLYDQSLGGYNLDFSATTSRQPKIVDAGKYLDLLRFDGIGNWGNTTMLPFNSAQMGVCGLQECHRWQSDGPSDLLQQYCRCDRGPYGSPGGFCGRCESTDNTGTSYRRCLSWRHTERYSSV